MIHGIILPVVSASALTRFTRYIYYWNLQFLNNVIIIKTKGLHSSGIYGLSRFWLSCLGPFVFIASKTYLAFQSLDFECTRSCVLNWIFTFYYIWILLFSKSRIPTIILWNCHILELTDAHFYKRITVLIWVIERWYWCACEIRCSTVFVFAIAAAVPVTGL